MLLPLSRKSLLPRLSFWNFLLCGFPRLLRTGCRVLRGGRPGGVRAAPRGLRVSSESSQRGGGVACRAGQRFPTGLPEVRSHQRPGTPHPLPRDRFRRDRQGLRSCRSGQWACRWWGGDPLCGRAHFYPVAQLFSLYFRPFCQGCKCHVHRVSHFLEGSGSQTFWFLEPFTLLKITGCPKSFVCVGYICQYSLYYRLKRRNA